MTYGGRGEEEGRDGDTSEGVACFAGAPIAVGRLRWRCDKDSWREGHFGLVIIVETYACACPADATWRVMYDWRGEYHEDSADTWLSHQMRVRCL